MQGQRQDDGDAGPASVAYRRMSKGELMPIFRIMYGGVAFAGLCMLWSQEPPHATAPQSRDAVTEAQRSIASPVKRPEQNKTPHDQSGEFSVVNADPSSS